MTQVEIREALGDACETTRDDLITRGRRLLARIVEKGGGAEVERVAYAELNLKEDWEYRRLGEVFATYYREALPRLIELGLRSENPEIVEVAAGMQADPNRFSFPGEERA